MAFIILYTVFNIYDLNTVTTNSDDSACHRLIGTVTVLLLFYENFAVIKLNEKL